MTTQTSRRKFIQAGMLSSFGALAGMASEASAAEKTEIQLRTHPTLSMSLF